MTKLVWDQAGQRRYETGIDRGVLYHPDGYAVPWSGLTAVNEGRTRDTTHHFHDGMRFASAVKRGAFAGTLKAITYPDDLDYLIGIDPHVAGVDVYDQKVRPFHLSYRTLVGDDTSADPKYYKIHVLYNVTAVPSDHEYATLSDQVGTTPFEFALTSVPYHYGGSGSAAAAYQPISHISIDSRQASPSVLAAIEAALYGDDANDPAILTPNDLLMLAQSS